MRRNSKRARWTRVVGCAVALTGCMLAARIASAEVTIVKTDTWEVYLAGRASAFFSYAFGDAYPVAPAGANIIAGGGIDDGGHDTIPKLDPATGMPDPAQQGTVSKMRIRSGYIPNVLTIGAKRKVGADTMFKAQMSIWGQIESTTYTDKLGGGGRFAPRCCGRDSGVDADFREGFLQIEGPWGGVQGGRFMSLFNRGMTETEFLYGHGYGVGFPAVVVGDYTSGSLTLPGPTAGMVGLGETSATYSAGLTYTTPSLAGLKLAAGLFEGVKLQTAGWDTSRFPRPEGELTYDLLAGSVKLHLFGNGAYQKLFSPGQTDTTSMYGAGYGGRVEIGPVHLGGGGHFGKGVGLTYAFDGSPTSASKVSMDATGKLTNELRDFRGFAVLAQVVGGPVDFNLGYGQTQVIQTAADKLPVNAVNILIKTQTGISAGVVYHVTENLHLDLDFLNASFAWYGNAQKQKVNFINTGVVMTF